MNNFNKQNSAVFFRACPSQNKLDLRTLSKPYLLLQRGGGEPTRTGAYMQLELGTRKCDVDSTIRVVFKFVSVNVSIMMLVVSVREFSGPTLECQFTD